MKEYDEDDTMVGSKRGVKAIEALPVFISSVLGLLYVIFFLDQRDAVLLVIFVLLLFRSSVGLLR